MKTGFEHMRKARPFRHRRAMNQFLVIHEGIVIAVVYNVPRKLTAAGVWMTFADNAYVTVTGSDEPVDCNDISFQQCDNHFDPKLPFISWEDWPNSNQGSSLRLSIEEED